MSSVIPGVYFDLPPSSSESFVNHGVVPEPTAILLVGSVLLISGRKLRAGAKS